MLVAHLWLILNDYYSEANGVDLARVGLEKGDNWERVEQGLAGRTQFLALRLPLLASRGLAS